MKEDNYTTRRRLHLKVDKQRGQVLVWVVWDARGGDRLHKLDHWKLRTDDRQYQCRECKVRWHDVPLQQASSSSLAYDGRQDTYVYVRKIEGERE